VDFKNAAFFLQHSLGENPSNLEIREGQIIEVIKKDDFFENKIHTILEKYNNETHIDIPLEKESLVFESNDLYFGINKAKISINGTKNNNKWNLKIHFNDTYDYTQFKDIEEYIKDTESIKKSLFSSTLYNLAHMSVKYGVMKVYEVDIYFDYEVNI